MISTSVPCPQCSELATFSKKRGQFYCSECEYSFDPPIRPIEPQTIFLSYAHKSEKADDYDVSEELVWHIKDELEKDGHKVWIDHEGISAGAQWRERITSAILGHTHFLSFLSKRSVRDPGVCLNEIAIALGSGRQIQTLLTESEEAVRQPLTISHLQWHQFVDWKAIKDGQKTGPKGETWDVWFGERMALIRENLSDVQQIKVAGDLQRLKETLEPRTFEADIIKSIEGFYGRKWLFDACEQWLNTSANRLFWLKGSPGIGKSAFAAKLVHQSNSAIVGFFKCEFQGSKSPEESASECIRTLAYQLATRLPDYRTKLLYQQLINKDKISKKTADDLFTYLITEPLNLSGKIPEATRLALVIDALDEAGRNDGTNALADLIYKHADKLPPWLGIIVTSRPEPYLEQQLGKFESTPIEGGTEQNLQDLRDYLNERLDPSIQESQRSAIIDQVIDKSGGTFLYLKLIEKDKTLDLAKPETLPAGIDDVFMRDFKRYFPDPKEYGVGAEPFLRLMAAAPGPLPVELAKELLGWSSRDVTTQVTQPLGSLLQEKNGGLVFFHKSISDWLQDSKRSGLYQVNDTGAKELGNFLWKEFERGDQSRWQSQVLEWLPALLPSTEYWESRESLIKIYQLISKRYRLRASIKLGKKHLELTKTEFGSESIQAAQSLNDLADIWYLMANSREAKPLYENALEIFRNQLGSKHLKTANVLRNLGNLLIDEGDFKSALPLLMEVLAIQEVQECDSKELISTVISLGIVNKELGDLEASKKLFEKSLEMCSNLSADDDIIKARSLNYLANLCRDEGDIERAKIFYLEALAIRERVLGESDPKTATTVTDLGSLFVNLGNYDLAEQYYRRALSIYENTFGLEHPFTTATVLNNLSSLYIQKQNYEAARYLSERALNIRRVTLGESHPLTISSLNTHASLLKLSGDITGAKDLFYKALNIREKLLGLDHPDTATSLHNLARVFEDEGNWLEALPLFKRALFIREAKLGNEHPSTISTLNSYGACLHQAGLIEDAQKVFECLIGIYTNKFGSNNLELGLTQCNLGAVLREQGNAEDAINAYQIALGVFEKILPKDHSYIAKVMNRIQECKEL